MQTCHHGGDRTKQTFGPGHPLHSRAPPTKWWRACATARAAGTTRGPNPNARQSKKRDKEKDTLNPKPWFRIEVEELESESDNARKTD